MKTFYRWLAPFIVGDVMMAAGTLVAVWPLGLVWHFVGALWEAGFDVPRAGVRFSIRAGHYPSPPDLFIAVPVAVILPGLFGAFALARWSLDHGGWLFWRWRQLG
jgi:hypothetical protein